ncbi:hypothetical protein [Algibacter sp.]|uniref:hypothetical protein n=1 Tax=Algibacter sp. TaxID=1872428 RepID=UPI003C7246F6
MRIKKIGIFFTIVLILTFFSCSNNDDSESKNLEVNEDLMISKGSWTFRKFEVSEILDNGVANISDEKIREEIEFDVTEDMSNILLSFKQDKTGAFDFEDGTNLHSFIWDVINENQLKLTFDNGTIEIHKNLTVSASSLSYETHWENRRVGYPNVSIVDFISVFYFE